jgi:hypothetical protein
MTTDEDFEQLEIDQQCKRLRRLEDQDERRTDQ